MSEHDTCSLLLELYDICISCHGDIPKSALVEGKCIWCWDKEDDDG